MGGKSRRGLGRGSATARPSPAPPGSARSGLSSRHARNASWSASVDSPDVRSTLQAIARVAARPEGHVGGFALPATADMDLRTATEKVASANVAGLIDGGDPRLRDQIIVLSAHLDHLGRTEPVNGDAIANGALDNASGMATLLDVARRFRAAGRPPRRPVLLLAFTGEEAGLLGSDYFLAHPTVPRASLASDLNLDMPILTYPFTDVVALGAELSTMGDAVTRAARSLGIRVAPAPAALKGDFERSDQYSFVARRVPPVFLPRAMPMAAGPPPTVSPSAATVVLATTSRNRSTTGRRGVSRCSTTGSRGRCRTGRRARAGAPDRRG